MDNDPSNHGNVAPTTSKPLDHKLDQARRAATMGQIDDPETVASLRHLGNLLGTRFQDSKECDYTLLDEWIKVERQIGDTCSSNHPYRAGVCQHLAASLYTCFRHLGDGSLLDEAILLYREAVSLTPSDHPSHLDLCRSLAASLQIRFQQLGDESLLSESISIKREILSLTPNGHPDRARSCQNLAVSLHTRFQQLGDESLLVEAIYLLKEALSLTPSGHSDRVRSCVNLAESLRTRFEQVGDELLLDESISFLREALSLTPSGHRHRMNSCLTLAASLHTRFQQLGDESLLDEAISLKREALSLNPRNYPDHAHLCKSLAISLHKRFEQLRDQSLLDEAIFLYREALSLTPSGHPHRAHSCRELAASLYTRFHQFGDRLLLDEAISLEREALSLLPSGHPDRERSCRSLGGSLYTRSQLLSDESSLRESVTLFQESIDLQPPHHPQQWYALTALARIHLDKQTPMYNMDLAIDYLCRAVSLNADSLPSLLLDVGSQCSQINPSNVPIQSRHKYLQCLSTAIDLASLVVGFVLDRQSQLRYLRSCQALGPSAYLCAALCDQKEFGLELLQNACAMMWTQLLHVRDPHFEGIPQDMASELQQLLRSITSSKSVETSVLPASGEHDSYLTPKDVRYQQNTRINQLIREIRALPGQEYFMHRMPFKNLARCAANHTVVVLIAGPQECRALILQSEQDAVEEVLIEHVTSEELEEWSVSINEPGMRGAVPNSSEAGERGMKISARQTSLIRVLYKLWTAIVRPVLDSLRLEKAEGLLRPRLHWCPTGVFTFFPLHAAGIYDKGREECCSDYVVSSYTPTLAALLRAQRCLPVISAMESRLVLIAAPKTRDHSLPVLPSVREEMNHVISIAKQAGLSVDEGCLQQSATLSYAASSLKSSTLAHIACHGIQNPTDALSSGFCLHDENLTISRLMELDLKHAFFAFLSACETAKGDARQPDQTVHLAAAMLFVGFRSVIATMWAMSDQDGPEVAGLFYERLFTEGQISLNDIPYALDYAVGQLRKSGVSPEQWATFIHMGA